MKSRLTRSERRGEYDTRSPTHTLDDGLAGNDSRTVSWRELWLGRQTADSAGANRPDSDVNADASAPRSSRALKRWLNENPY
jgi:hypothetical protein